MGSKVGSPTCLLHEAEPTREVGTSSNNWAERIRTELLEVSLAHSSLSHKLRYLGKGRYSSDGTFFAIAQAQHARIPASDAGVQKPGGSGRRMRDTAAHQRSKKEDLAALTTNLVLPVFQQQLQEPSSRSPDEGKEAPQNRPVSTTRRALKPRAGTRKPVIKTLAESTKDSDNPHDNANDDNTGPPFRGALSDVSNQDDAALPTSREIQSQPSQGIPPSQPDTISRKGNKGRDLSRRGKDMSQQKTYTTSQLHKRPSHSSVHVMHCSERKHEQKRVHTKRSSHIRMRDDKHVREQAPISDSQNGGCNKVNVPNTPQNQSVYRVVSVSDCAADSSQSEPHYDYEKKQTEGQCTARSYLASNELCRVLVARDCNEGAYSGTDTRHLPLGEPALAASDRGSM